LRGLKVRVVDERVKTVKCARMREQNKSIDPTGLIRVPLATSERDEHVRRPRELQET